MTVFEYLMVMVSMVLALALAQLLRGATEIFSNPNRYWVHSTWVVFLIFMIVQTWWAFWDWNTFTNWNFLSFLFVLSFPIGIFIVAYLLVPANRTANMDWFAHFYKVHVSVFMTMALIGLVGIALSWVLLGIPLLHPYRIFQSTFVILSVAAATAKSHKVHAPLVVIYCVLFVASQLLARMQIGALASSG